ncbi:aminoglycoside phosphotransferase family protein [Microbacterium sp. STN6]|uniref:aminoglycoside phosphotransferase family protein n=1 Tax=Microbacterium sp. STN6 TaxID=2995588 RepID=UPI002260BFE3|nr:aminoglycoside phosphotransferase family protein [Microbacterium sp. STN6]MCX7523124.1 aminoglycoside phosphotransferase family protein [Microbacterium sp. STN6]
MDAPAAEVHIDAALVERLIEAQHPDLAAPVRLVTNGWDNALFRLGDRHAVRLPRREAAAELVVNEQRWLPDLTKRLPVPVPVPVRRGAPGIGYPWSWSITDWFDGTDADLVPAAERAAVAIELAEFLAALHHEAPTSAPFNPVRGVPLPTRSAAMVGRLDSGSLPRVDDLRALWNRLVTTPPWGARPVWLHGDPHPGNAIMTTDAAAAPRLAAILDFGDITAGDPATDLAAAWMWFEPAGRALFRAHIDELCHVDTHTWQRARGWALNMGAAIAAASDDNPRLAAIGAHTLTQVLLDD